MSAEVCPVKVYRDAGGWSQSESKCGKPVKRDGLCGIHAAAKERAAQKEVDEAAAREAAKVTVARLNAHGVECYSTYRGDVHVSMSAEALADLLDGRSS